MSTEITHKTKFVSDKGGTVDIVLDGEVMASLAVPAGIVRASVYLGLVPPGGELQVSKGLYAHNPRSGVGIQPYGEGSHDSGANPDFQPASNAQQLERRLMRLVAGVQQENRSLHARQRATEKLLGERIPKPAKQDPDPVIEPVDEPAPVDGKQ